MKARLGGGLSLTSIIALALAANGAVLLALATARLFDHRSAFSTESLLALCWFVVLLLFLLWRTPKALQPLFAVTAAVLFEAYTVRATVLALDPSLYSYSSSIRLEPGLLVQSVGYMSLAIIVYWVALRSRPVRHRAAAASQRRIQQREQGRSPVLQHSLMLLVLANMTMVTVTALNVAQGLSQGSGFLAIALSVAPIDAFLYAVVYLCACHWLSLATGQRFAAVTYVVMFGLNGLALGSRGAILAISLAIVIVLLLARPNLRLRSRWLVAGAMLLIAVFVPLLNLTVGVRDDVRSGSAGLLELADAGLSTPSSELHLMDAFEMITNRQAGLDATYAVLHADVRGIEKYIGPLPLVQSSLMTLWSDEALGFQAHATGAVFAHFYQGHRFYSGRQTATGHYGAFSGFGFAAAYFGRLGGLAFMGVLGATVGLLFSRWNSRTLLQELIPVYLIGKLAFQFFESGNLDLILAGAAKQLVAFSVIVMLARLMTPDSLSRRAWSPDAVVPQPAALSP